MTKLVAYYRVSTKKQGDSGLGLEAQRAAVADYSTRVGGWIVAEFTEIESGRRAANRPKLLEGLAHARNSGATLIVAKLDRLSRNVAFLSTLMECKVPFVACDNPHANEFTLHILAAVAEAETKAISARVKAALGAYKAGGRVSKRIRDTHPKGVPTAVAAARGGKLGASLPECRNLTSSGREAGRKAGVAKRVETAGLKAREVGPEAARMRAAGVKLKAIAVALNSQGLVTTRGKPWTHVAVIRLLSLYKSSYV